MSCILSVPVKDHELVMLYSFRLAAGVYATWEDLPEEVHAGKQLARLKGLELHVLGSFDGEWNKFL